MQEWHKQPSLCAIQQRAAHLTPAKDRVEPQPDVSRTVSETRQGGVRSATFARFNQRTPFLSLSPCNAKDW